MNEKAKMGPQTPEGIAKVTQTIQKVNAEGRNRRERPGVHGIKTAQPETQELAAEIMAILNGDGLGHIGLADSITVELLAVCLRKIRQCEKVLELSLTKKDGSVRPVAFLLRDYLREGRAFCEALGMTPLSRAKLGLEKVRAVDLVGALAELARSERKNGTDNAR